MMSAINKNLKYVMLAIVSCGLSACTSTETEEFKPVETTSSVMGSYRPLHKQLNETATLESDQKNIRYESREKVEAAAIKPVVRENASAQTVKIDKDKEFKKIIERAKADKHAAKMTSTTMTNSANGGPLIAYQAATILFADGSAAVAPGYNAEIRKIAKLAQTKNAHITVYGFSSSRTRNTDMATHKMINFKTSLKRAENVAAALIRAGAPKKSVAVVALSDSQPLYQEIMPEGERLNRRAEIYISY